MNAIFTEIGVIVIVATAFAMLARLLKQPPLFGYILAGIVLGPIGAHFIQNHELLDGLKEIGVSLLLFLIGLELDWSKTKHQLKTAATIGLIQIVGSFATGVLLAFLGHQSIVAGMYLGFALAFSSTVIVVKLLSESRDLNSLHGRLTVGILLIQDIVAMVALVVVSGLASQSSLPVSSQLVLLIVKTAALFTVVWVASQYVLPYFFSKLARSSELLFLASVAWCFIFTLAMARFDFPIEMGAFLAGISLAALPYNLDILARLRSLRDFFVILFFVSLGSALVLPSLPYMVLTFGLVGLTVFVKPFITFASLTAHGYRSRTAFLASITQGQLSEFSLILVAIGLLHHQLSPSLASSISFAAILSILISTFFYSHRNDLYHGLQGMLRLAERGRRHDHEHLTEDMESRLHEHIVIFGYHRMGYHILKKLHQLHHQLLVVDFNPDIIQKLRAAEIDCVYGDVEDEEILDHIRLEHASMVVSTIPHREETLFLIEKIKKKFPAVRLIVTSHSIDDALEFYHLGADYVILPHLLGGEHVADLITQYQEHSLGKFMKSHQEELKLLRAKNHALYFD